MRKEAPVLNNWSEVKHGLIKINLSDHDLIDFDVANLCWSSDAATVADDVCIGDVIYVLVATIAGD